MAKDKEKKNEAELDPNYDFQQELVQLAKRKKGGRKWTAIFSLILSSFIIISFVGYLVGQQRASAASVRLTNKAKDISLANVGFRTQVALTPTELETHFFTADESNAFNDTYIYWTTNRVSQKTFKFIVEKSGHPEGLSLNPITSRAFKTGDEIKLYNNYSGVQYDNRHLVNEALASHENYFGFDVLFKVEAKNVESLLGYPFYFESGSKFQGYNDIDQALRLGFTSSTTSDIIRPLASGGGITESSVAVGGRLDLGRQLNDEQHYYDYSNATEDGKRYEIAFGDFEETLTDEHWESEPNSATSEDEVQTAPGVYRLKLETITPKRAYFKNSFRHYSYINNIGNAIAYTDENGIAEVNVKIWLEGWDAASTDDIDGINFEAYIGFMVRDKDE